MMIWTGLASSVSLSAHTNHLCDMWWPAALSGPCFSLVAAGFLCWMICSLLCGAFSLGSAVHCCAACALFRELCELLRRLCFVSRAVRVCFPRPAGSRCTCCFPARALRGGQAG